MTFETQMDIDTPTGLAEAVVWTNEHMSRLRPGGVWGIPRSGMRVMVISHDPKACRVLPGWNADPSVVRVLKAGGWTIKTEGALT